MQLHSLSPVLSVSGFQPSIYLRLLENPSAVADGASFLCSLPSSHCPSSCSRSQSPSRSKSPLRTIGVTEGHDSGSVSPDPSGGFSVSDLSASGPHQSSERSEASMQQVNFISLLNGIYSDDVYPDCRLLSLQSKSQRLSARDFSKRSIKDRAGLLSSMFHGSSKPSAPLPDSQVEYRRSDWHENICA